MYDKPTDIIGFGEIGHALAWRLDGLVGRKEICYYSHNQNDPDFHFWPFADMVERLGGVAFESDDPEILGHKYKSNIFVTPHNAHCTSEALARMFEIWINTICSVTRGEIINRVN